MKPDSPFVDHYRLAVTIDFKFRHLAFEIAKFPRYSCSVETRFLVEKVEWVITRFITHRNHTGITR